MIGKNFLIRVKRNMLALMTVQVYASGTSLPDIDKKIRDAKVPRMF